MFAAGFILSWRHRELEKADIKTGEDAIKRVISATKNFTNPFAIADKERLYSLVSGAPVPLEVEVDVLRSEAAGNAASGLHPQPAEW